MRFAPASYLVAALSLAGCSLNVAGLPGGFEGGSGCGDQIVGPGEACDDSSPFCNNCQFVCPPGWVPSPTTATCYHVFPPPYGTEGPDWSRTKAWVGANIACAAEAPARQYKGRLAGPGVISVIRQFAAACPQFEEGGRGGCWFGAQCLNNMTCKDENSLLEWSDRSLGVIISDEWSGGNPSGDGVCLEYIPNEGVNDDDCNREEHYICEVTITGP